MNRAERRARSRWQEPAPVAPLDAAMAQTAVVGDAYARLAAVMNATAVKMVAAGGATPAEAEALDRWAIPAAAAFRRATADLERLTSQLVGIASLEGGG
ncbi:hypothetical protein MKK69_19460 [Methylobacterium sp. J-026]|uniref:hypothetical protein n=1 Tax=Methylobacterium sp. J-026 TaxID=2836624 RepID=UPI001FB8E5CE|nr:hypothetical protein [Methylobacterium sp. J-026]MCJ2136202.1 hypothetical protein [Methylobacterium sp. J-026]